MTVAGAAVVEPDARPRVGWNHVRTRLSPAPGADRTPAGAERAVPGDSVGDGRGALPTESPTASADSVSACSRAAPADLDRESRDDDRPARRLHGEPPVCLVIGTGLIGTSVGLALTDQGWPVFLDDRDPGSVELAVDLGAGRPVAALPAPEAVEVVVVAVTPSATAEVISRSLSRYLNATVTDVASIKSQPQREVQARTDDLTRVCGGHPIAGRERSGPAAARHDLFVGLPWVVCPSPHTSSRAVLAVEKVALACSAYPVRMAPADHDRALAAVSHLPQLVASATASALRDLPEQALALSGRGLADTTRIAASDPQLWVEIVTGNSEALVPLLDTVVSRLLAVRDSLVDAPDALSREVVRGLMKDGNDGHARLPGKHGRRSAAFRAVPVLVGDAPGQLADLFADVAEIGVNIEDVALEHAPGRPLGVAELAVQPELESGLREGLTIRGWTVRTQPG